MLRILELWHLASLDAPTVAVVWALAFAFIIRVHLEPWILLLLACGTWTVYIGDRLLDARRAVRSHAFDDLRERHYFHWHYRRILIPIAVCSAALAVLLILRLMPLAVEERDSVIGAAALAYFSGVHSPAKLPAWIRPIVSKEFLVGALFTAGCAAPVISHLHSKNLPALACILFLALVAWLNCAAIETWESSAHRPVIGYCAAILSAVGVIGAILVFAKDGRASGLLCTGAFSALLLFHLDRIRYRIPALMLRALADLVLLTPAVLLVFGAHRP